MATKQIHVLPTDKAGNLVILYESDSDHPGGELFLRGYADPERRAKEGPRKVGDTSAIRQKIHEGYLVETTATGKIKDE